MGKPFKLQGPKVAIGRGDGGKFVRIEDPCPGKVHEEAKAKGESVEAIVAAKRAPDHPVGSETPKDVEADDRNAVYDDVHPWPEAGPVNDAGQKPMRLKD